MSKRKKRPLGSKPSERKRPFYVFAHGPIDRSLSRSEREAVIKEGNKALLETFNEVMNDAQGKKALVMGPRVGTIENVLSRDDIEIATCEMCGHDIWITTSVKEAITSKGMKVVTLCVKDCDNPECSWDFT
jgi:hypothetical protein